MRAYDCQVDVDGRLDAKGYRTVVFKVYITEKFKWFTSLGFDGVDLDRILQHAERINSERVKESRFVFIQLLLNLLAYEPLESDQSTSK